MFIALGAIAAPAPAGAQGNRWERHVQDQLRRAAGALHVARAVPAASRVGPLNGEESEFFAVRLEAGVPYTVVGVCDDDCANLQLVLTTAAGNELAAERASESFPVLQFTPRDSGAFRVRVVMAKCQMNPCWYGVAVYRK
jgi:hypothetical protein